MAATIRSHFFTLHTTRLRRSAPHVNAKVRIDVLDGHKQVFITDEADVAAVLAAIGTKQSPKSPTGNFSFDMSLNFFDGEDKVHGEALGVPAPTAPCSVPDSSCPASSPPQPAVLVSIQS